MISVKCTKLHRQKALSFKSVSTGASKCIHSCLSSAYEGQVEKNRAVLLSIIDVVLVLGQRNIAFRGHSWNKESKREDGNFDHFIHWKSTFDPILQQHLLHGKKNCILYEPKDTE